MLNDFKFAVTCLVDVDQCYRGVNELPNADKGTNEHWHREFRALAAKGHAQKRLSDEIAKEPLSRDHIENIARSIISEKYDGEFPADMSSNIEMPAEGVFSLNPCNFTVSDTLYNFREVSVHVWDSREFGL